MEPGDEIDRYTILRAIGRGGMGEVYKAHDKRLHRNVALKILRPDRLEEEIEEGQRSEVVARMFREARAAAALEHPNVIVIHDVSEVVLEGEAEATCFIAMEFIEGKVLRNYLGSAEVSLDTRLSWLADVARALAFAHERGIVHRDVKPDNVIIRDDGTVKVLDFGIARRATGLGHSAAATTILPTLTEKGIALGTPKYMAPEQMRNEELDGRADQYSWGLTAYELLCGKTPWSGASDSVQLIAEMLSRDPEPLRMRDPSIPADVAEVIERTLGRRREDRYPSMQGVVEALEGCRTSLFPPARSARRLPPAQSAPRETLPSVREAETLAGPPSTRASPAILPPSKPPPPARPRLWLAAAGGLVVVASALAIVRSMRPHPGIPPAVPPVGCAANAECTNEAGAPSVCRRIDRRCIPLASDDCRVSAEPGDVMSDATVWIGAMFPLSGPDADAYGQREFRAVDLARSDFAHIMAGTNTRPKGAHPLALLACDDAVDPARALRHLVEDVGVPAVIGFRTSNEAIDLATSTLIPRGVLGVSALNTSPMISSLPRAPGEPRMIWRTTYSGAQTALPIALVVPAVFEPEVRATPRALGPGGRLRVALLRQDDAAGLGFADVLFRNLRYNGRSALDNEADFRELSYVAAARGEASEYERIAAKLVAFAPHVVIDFGADEPLARVVEPLERDWKEAAFRPRYVKASALGPGILKLIGASAERRRRFFSVTSVATTPANARFVSRYNEAFAEGSPDGGSGAVTRTFSPNSSYDAFYVVAYATYAAGDAPITGAALARAIPKLLPPGKPIDVGPSAIFDAFNTLRAGGNVDLNGATGALDFDVDTGDAPVDLAVLCVNADAHDNVESGLVYDSSAHKLRGALRCP